MQEPDPDHDHAEDRGDRRVLVNRPGQRVGALEVQAVDHLTGEAAGVGPGGGGRRAGEDRQRPERRQRSDRPHADPVVGRAAAIPARTWLRHASATAAIRITIDSAKCAITKPGARCSRTVKPPSTAWASDAERQQQRQDRQVPPERAPRERQHRRHHRDHPDHARDRPVAELDQRVRAERRQRRAPALRPVLAAEPRVGQPHGGAGQHDQGQRRQRRRRRRGGTGSG